MNKKLMLLAVAALIANPVFAEDAPKAPEAPKTETPATPAATPAPAQQPAPAATPAATPAVTTPATPAAASVTAPAANTPAQTTPEAKKEGFMASAKVWAAWFATPAAFVVGYNDVWFDLANKKALAASWFNRAARVTLVTLLAQKAHEAYVGDAEDCEYNS